MSDLSSGSVVDDVGRASAWDTANVAVAGWLDARHFLIDLDGTLAHQHRPADGAVALIRRLAGRYVIVSNNSTHTAKGLAHVLAKRGLAVSPDRLVLAGEETVRYMAQQHANARIRLVASVALRRRASHLGCRLVDAEPDFVVLARDERFTYAKLQTIANDLRQGARLMVTNPDLSHPAHDGRVVPETGALMRAVVDCSGVPASVVFGKPEGLLFREGMRRLSATPADTVVIGDNPQTDALGAARLGMRCLLLGQGPEAVAASPAELLAMA